MKVTCFGSTGSIPAASNSEFDRRTFGGNTTCFLVETPTEDIIIDMGSGAANAGRYLINKYKMFLPTAEKRNIDIFLTHYHWDHIQGIPFFAPLYFRKNSVNFYGFDPRQDRHGKPEVENKVLDMLAHQQSTPNFPVPFREMPADKEYYSHSPMFSEVAMEGSSKVTTVPLNHPDGCTGYVVESEGKKVAFLFDNENWAYPNTQILKLAKDADLAFMDCQYTKGQLSGMCQGFGHGQAELNIAEAQAAGIKKMVGCHLDPTKSDTEMQALEIDIRKTDIGFNFVREGQVFEV
jgi:phosphoribosyl 1,2-cyclic phosphodiesterase